MNVKLSWFRKSERGQGAVGSVVILGFVGIVLLVFCMVLLPDFQKGIQSIPAPPSMSQIQPMSDVAIVAEVALDCSTLPSSHAVGNHGTAAWTAINACNNPGARTMVHINPATKRKMTGCMLDGKIYVVIDDENGKNVNAFQKDDFRFWDELVRYFRFSGYTR